MGDHGPALPWGVRKGDSPCRRPAGDMQPPARSSCCMRKRKICSSSATISDSLFIVCEIVFVNFISLIRIITYPSNGRLRYNLPVIIIRLAAVHVLVQNTDFLHVIPSGWSKNKKTPSTKPHTNSLSML